MSSGGHGHHGNDHHNNDNKDNSGNRDPGSPRAAPLRRSGPSRIRSFVRFINYTERRVDVIWLNHEGLGVRYRTLSPRQAVDVNTFVGHPWIFRDSQTGDRLCVQLREVYEPIAWNSEPDSPRRRQVFITNQLYSLRDRCIQEVRRLVPMSRIHQLELPREISQDLRIHCQDLPVLSLYDQAARSIIAEADQAVPDPAGSLNLTSNPIAAASSNADCLGSGVSSSSGSEECAAVSSQSLSASSAPACSSSNITASSAQPTSSTIDSSPVRPSCSNATASSAQPTSLRLSPGRPSSSNVNTSPLQPTSSRFSSSPVQPPSSSLATSPIRPSSSSLIPSPIRPSSSVTLPDRVTSSGTAEQPYFVVHRGQSHRNFPLEMASNNNNNELAVDRNCNNNNNANVANQNRNPAAAANQAQAAPVPTSSSQSNATLPSSETASGTTSNATGITSPSQPTSSSTVVGSQATQDTDHQAMDDVTPGPSSSSGFTSTPQLNSVETLCLNSSSSCTVTSDSQSVSSTDTLGPPPSLTCHADVAEALPVSTSSGSDDSTSPLRPVSPQIGSSNHRAAAADTTCGIGMNSASSLQNRMTVNDVSTPLRQHGEDRQNDLRQHPSSSSDVIRTDHRNSPPGPSGVDSTNGVVSNTTNSDHVTLNGEAAAAAVSDSCIMDMSNGRPSNTNRKTASSEADSSHQNQDSTTTDRFMLPLKKRRQ